MSTSTIFNTVTQATLNGLNYAELDKILWMLTNTGKVQAIDWGNPIESSDPDQVKAWCESVNADYDAEISGTKMVSKVRKQLCTDAPTDAPTEKTQKTVTELRTLCKELGVKNPSKMKKAELQAALDAALQPAIDAEDAARKVEPEPETEAESDDEIATVQWPDDVDDE